MAIAKEHVKVALYTSGGQTRQTFKVFFGQQPSFRSANLLPFNEYNPPLSQGKTAGRLVTNQKPKAIPDKQ